MTATEQLRAMLDERGVPYVSAFTTGGYQHTSWRDGDYREVSAVDFGEGKLMFHGNITPAQAVAVTLGERQHEEIVLCRDCKHFTANDEFWLEPPQVPFPMIGATSDSCDFWAGTKCKVEPNGFCAWGEVDE